MKILIMTDMEGVSGIVTWGRVGSGKPMYDEGRRLYTAEVNAAVRGASRAGANEIVVVDGHNAGGDNKGNSLIPEMLDPACEWVAHHPWTRYTELLEQGADACLMVGYHARAHTADGVLSHTITSVKWHNLWLDSAGGRLPRAPAGCSASGPASRCSNRIRAAAKSAGLGDGFTGHSPRVGMAVDLVASGASVAAVQVAGRWVSDRMPSHYAAGVIAGRGAVARFHGEGLGQHGHCIRSRVPAGGGSGSRFLGAILGAHGPLLEGPGAAASIAAATRARAAARVGPPGSAATASGAFRRLGGRSTSRTDARASGEGAARDGQGRPLWAFRRSGRAARAGVGIRSCRPSRAARWRGVSPASFRASGSAPSVSRASTASGVSGHQEPNGLRRAATCRGVAAAVAGVHVGARVH